MSLFAHYRFILSGSRQAGAVDRFYQLSQPARSRRWSALSLSLPSAHPLTRARTAVAVFLSALTHFHFVSTSFELLIDGRVSTQATIRARKQLMWLNCKVVYAEKLPDHTPERTDGDTAKLISLEHLNLVLQSGDYVTARLIVASPVDTTYDWACFIL